MSFHLRELRRKKKKTHKSTVKIYFSIIHTIWIFLSFIEICEKHFSKQQIYTCESFGLLLRTIKLRGFFFSSLIRDFIYRIGGLGNIMRIGEIFDWYNLGGRSKSLRSTITGANLIPQTQVYFFCWFVGVLKYTKKKLWNMNKVTKT